MTPKELYAVICETGAVCVDENGLTYVAQTYSEAEEYLELIRSSGSQQCWCDDHRIVTYVPQVKP